MSVLVTVGTSCLQADKLHPIGRYFWPRHRSEIANTLSGLAEYWRHGNNSVDALYSAPALRVGRGVSIESAPEGSPRRYASRGRTRGALVTQAVNRL